MADAPGILRDDCFDDLLGDFLDESGQLLDRLNENLLQLDEWVRATDPAAGPRRCDGQLLNEMFRSAHSLKGLSAMLGLGEINTLTHKIENVFDAARKDELTVNGNVVEVVFHSVDLLGCLIAVLKEPDPAPWSAGRCWTASRPCCKGPGPSAGRAPRPTPKGRWTPRVPRRHGAVGGNLGARAARAGRDAAGRRRFRRPGRRPTPAPVAADLHRRDGHLARPAQRDPLGAGARRQPGGHRDADVRLPPHQGLGRFVGTQSGGQVGAPHGGPLAATAGRPRHPPPRDDRRPAGLQRRPAALCRGAEAGAGRLGPAGPLRRGVALRRAGRREAERGAGRRPSRRSSMPWSPPRPTSPRRCWWARSSFSRGCPWPA